MEHEGLLLQTSLHMGSAAEVTEGGRRNRKWYLHVREWPRMLLNSFYVGLDRFLKHPAPFKFLWKIDSGFKLLHLEVVQFLDLFCSLGFNTKQMESSEQALLSQRVLPPSSGSPACFCFCGFFRLNSTLLSHLQGNFGDLKRPKVEREPQGRRVRSKLYMIV